MLMLAEVPAMPQHATPLSITPLLSVQSTRYTSKSYDRTPNHR
jgi:hypothetical protein